MGGLCAKFMNETRNYEVDNKSLAVKNETRSTRLERNKDQLQNNKSNESEQQI